MIRKAPELFTAPVFLGTGFLLVAMAIIEKGLNIVGFSLPVVTVFPRQLLDWSLVLVTFEIAITLRQIAYRLDSGPESVDVSAHTN
ncbi:MAG: hypothetical protein HKN72_15275 [Gemmatimonadetes bacterium]|nr:hypothetical protein [Gemmatimonadota bacterium]